MLVMIEGEAVNYTARLVDNVNNGADPFSSAGGVTADIHFTTPSRIALGSGYVGYTFLNPDGGAYTNEIFYTDGCPVKGEWGAVDCNPCPEGAECPGGNRLWPLPGWWNTGEGSGQVQRCLPGRCLGYDAEAHAVICAVGYQGRLCGSCADGYYDKDGVCDQCSSKAVSLSLLVVDIGVVALLIFAMFTLSNKGLSEGVFVIGSFQLIRLIGIAFVEETGVWERVRVWMGM